MSEELKHCCHIMNAYAEKINSEELIEYQPEIRAYTFLLYEKGKYTGVQHELWYCPWCGKKLPESLSFKIGDVLEEEYGITEKDWDNESKIPEEFKTDEWWKKRGL